MHTRANPGLLWHSLRGVKDVCVQAGAYVGKPVDSEILTMAQPLNGMTSDSPADATKPPQPSEWTRSLPGNIFYGIVGLILGFGARELLAGADLAQRIWTGEADPAVDQAAIKVGFASVVNNTITFESLAAAIKARINELATSAECKLCDEGPWTSPATNP